MITTLTKEGTPLLRYRTRDITYLDRSPCPCGRTTARMHRVLGRTDDMLIIRGVNVFPSQIEEVILKVEGVEPHYQLVVERRDQLDELEVQVEMNEKMFSDEIRGLEKMEQQDRSRPVRGPEHPHPGEARGAQEHRPQRRQGKADHRQAAGLRLAEAKSMSVKQISDIPGEQERQARGGHPAPCRPRGSTSARFLSPTPRTSACFASS